MAGYTITVQDTEPITGERGRLLELKLLLSEAELFDLDACGNPAGLTLRLDTIDAMIRHPDGRGALLTVAEAFMKAATQADQEYEHDVREPQESPASPPRHAVKLIAGEHLWAGDFVVINQVTGKLMRCPQGQRYLCVVASNCAPGDEVWLPIPDPLGHVDREVEIIMEEHQP